MTDPSLPARHTCGLTDRDKALLCVCIDRYVGDIRRACREDQGTSGGRSETVGHTMQNELRALREKLRDA